MTDTLQMAPEAVSEGDAYVDRPVLVDHGDVQVPGRRPVVSGHEVDHLGPPLDPDVDVLVPAAAGPWVAERAARKVRAHNADLHRRHATGVQPTMRTGHW